MKRQKFRTELLTGHKGAAVLVPFDPAKTWGTRPVSVASRAYGKRPGHLVRVTLNGHAFDGWIGHRWGEFFILVDEDLRDAAGVAIGDMVEVTAEPRPAEEGTPGARGAVASKSRRPSRSGRV